MRSLRLSPGATQAQAIVARLEVLRATGIHMIRPFEAGIGRGFDLDMVSLECDELEHSSWCL